MGLVWKFFDEIEGHPKNRFPPQPHTVLLIGQNRSIPFSYILGILPPVIQLTVEIVSALRNANLCTSIKYSSELEALKAALSFQLVGLITTTHASRRGSCGCGCAVMCLTPGGSRC